MLFEAKSDSAPGSYSATYGVSNKEWWHFNEKTSFVSVAYLAASHSCSRTEQLFH